jgi:6-phosphogluconate dehydrogenase
MEIGLIGLGKMGYNIALNMKEKGHRVVAYNRSLEKVKAIEKEGVEGAYSIQELTEKFSGRKAIWIMVPAGSPVDEMIEKLVPHLNEGDIVIDAGNSHYKDTLRRYQELKEKNIDFVDVGTSGGTSGARWGACTMIGAEDDVFQYLEPIFKDICVEKGYLHTGENGTGHFVKMIHNGIEYGMMQAIGEGFEILHTSSFDLNLEKVAQVWNHGSVVRSWLMELTESAFKKRPQLEDITGVIRSSGEGLWTVQEALELKVPAPVITQSLFTRYGSEQQESFSGKVVAALRDEFGGHGVVKHE